jgi:riboflavin synthase
MFTGIVEGTGLVAGLKREDNLAVLSLRAPGLVRGVRPGDSVAVNGVCLTVRRVYGGVLIFDMMKETLEKTTLGACRAGDKVNMERALRAQSRLGGHYVTGHVDDTVLLAKVMEGPNYTEFRFRVGASLRPYIAEKGSVCLDGVSLTVGKVSPAGFSVYLIPFTLKLTTLGIKKPGDRVNMEVDLLARYVREQIRHLKKPF